MDLSDAYANAAHIPGAADFPPRWSAAAEAFRTELAEEGRFRSLAYGSGAREALDLFLPEGEATGLVVFVHGGYWLRFDRSVWSHFAAGALAAGWAVAMPSYDLCPDVRISEITRQVAAALCRAAAEIAGPIRLTGHSAGGHLVARMLAPGLLPEQVASRITGVVPISPLSDLRPLMQTEMNAGLKLDEAEALAESPIRQPAPRVPVTVWVGGDERPVFLDQARWLGEAWGCDVVIDAGLHHFDVIDGLAEAGSPLCKAVTGD
ncbi:alpha/beta hydrolase [Salipiger mangrovisoli]|uniref:Alpha/beta hydrolase fold domain-containing protein n=1 Tax=Salipiger mangrovisoli TaxID=2865933 RepID=A0ABR9WXT3_9RHOB|nr:alpha/beta hydrolase fold domain-containing protein [Salipiger mangrovisoli]MBE9636056.1 alpha/beta hydrolase fold domain-containing protein [Salipiger mangrovisoli]